MAWVLLSGAVRCRSLSIGPCTTSHKETAPESNYHPARILRLNSVFTAFLCSSVATHVGHRRTQMNTDEHRGTRRWLDRCADGRHSAPVRPSARPTYFLLSRQRD